LFELVRHRISEAATPGGTRVCSSLFLKARPLLLGTDPVGDCPGDAKDAHDFSARPLRLEPELDDGFTRRRSGFLR